MEIWKDVEGYEDYYQVSNFGRVRSKDRLRSNGDRGYCKVKGKILKNAKNELGYHILGLSVNGNRKMVKVHRLVAKAFISNPERKPFVNHMDGNPQNNHVSNLEWCTQKENMQHAYDSGLMKSNFTKNKEKILEEYTKNLDTNVKQLARKYRCSESTIRKHLKKEGIEIRGRSHTQNIYKIDRKRMVEMFEQGYKNKEIIEELGGNRCLIGVYRYKYKKGELKI